MITGAPAAGEIDRLWLEFWQGGVTNPLTVIEQITFLMFVAPARHRRESRQREAGRTATGKPLRTRTSRPRPAAACAGNTGARTYGGDALLETMCDDQVFPHLQEIAGKEYAPSVAYMHDATCS
jgi:type I restriction enzyme M protein